MKNKQQSIELEMEICEPKIRNPVLEDQKIRNRIPDRKIIVHFWEFLKIENNKKSAVE